MRRKARATDPLINKSDIERLKEYMLTSSTDSEICRRNYTLVVVGINLGLRASDLCNLKVGDFKDTHIHVKEKKTNKMRVIFINEAVRQAVESHIAQCHYISDEAYLFPSRKGQYIQPKHVHKIIKKACRDLEIRGNYGSHSLRKTMAYHILQGNKGNPEIITLIMDMFQHSKPDVTRRYLQPSAPIDEQYEKLNL